MPDSRNLSLFLRFRRARFSSTLADAYLVALPQSIVCLYAPSNAENWLLSISSPRCATCNSLSQQFTYKVVVSEGVSAGNFAEILLKITVNGHIVL